MPPHPAEEDSGSQRRRTSTTVASTANSSGSSNGSSNNKAMASTSLPASPLLSMRSIRTKSLGGLGGMHALFGSNNKENEFQKDAASAVVAATASLQSTPKVKRKKKKVRRKESSSNNNSNGNGSELAKIDVKLANALNEDRMADFLLQPEKSLISEMWQPEQKPSDEDEDDEAGLKKKKSGSFGLVGGPATNGFHHISMTLEFEPVHCDTTSDDANANASCPSEHEPRCCAEALERAGPALVLGERLLDDEDEPREHEQQAAVIRLPNSSLRITITAQEEVEKENTPPATPPDTLFPIPSIVIDFALDRQSSSDEEDSVDDAGDVHGSGDAKERKVSESSSFLDSWDDDLSLLTDEDDAVTGSGARVPRLEDGKVTQTFVDDLVAFYRDQGRLPSATAVKILRDAKCLFEKQPSLVDIELGRNDVINICGDIHGQFYDLANIFDLFGQPNDQNMYLFNGDFVDRGPWGVEVIFVLFSYKLLNPDHFFLVRGNHETEEITRMYGFHAEVRAKYDDIMYHRIQEVFSWLPVAHCINQSVLCMHGGLFGQDGVTLEDIRSIKRGCRQPERDTLMCDLMWADPKIEQGREPSHRGYSVLFGPDVTNRFLAENNLLYIVRSHECQYYGYDLTHDDKVITVFSAPNYCDRHDNKGAVCVLHGDDISMPEFKKFVAVKHPKVEHAYYTRNFAMAPERE